MKKFLKINSYISKFLLYSIPIILIVLVWASFQNQQQVLDMNNSIIYFVWNLISIYFLVWFFFLIYFLIVLVFSRQFRENILIKFSGIKERDERETYINGKACKSTFFSTIAILLLLLFLTVVNIQVIHLSPENAIDNKRRQISISLSLKFFNFDSKQKKDKNGTILSIHKLPLTTEATIILIILWQILSYHYFSRKNN